MEKLLILLFCILFANDSFAQAKQISYLNKGEQTPFSGLLLSPAAYAELNFKNEENEEIFKLKLTTEIERNILPLQLNIDNLKAQLELSSKACQERLEAKDNTIFFYENKIQTKPSFWESIDFETGLAIGVVSTILVILVVDELNDNFIED
jgi:hypothetical protein